MSYGGAAAAPASEIGEGAARAAPPIDGHIAGAGSCIRPTFHVDPLVTNECGDRSAEDVCARSSLSWGTRGAGAQELAWAFIRDATGDCRLADDWCADLGGEVVSRLPTDEFRLEAANIVAWLDASPVAPASTRRCW
jgi:hypothetical protein